MNRAVFLRPRAAILTISLVVASAPGLLRAQSTTYRAPERPLHWVSENPFRLYVLRGADTIGAPVNGIQVIRDRWVPSDTGFRIHRESVDLGLFTRRTTDSLLVTERGEVVLYNGARDYNEGEWDTLLRLPPGRLRVGTTWSDTLSHPTEGPAGEGVYSSVRDYRASRTIDSAGVVGIEVMIDAHLDFALSMWTDSTAGTYRWFDLAGPVTERFVFDPEEGQLVLREWSMHLTGEGGDFDGERSDTVLAGLRSENLRYRIDAPRAEALMAPLPGTDTTLTFRDGTDPIFMHTFGRSPEALVEGFRRADGLVGTARVTSDEAGPASWTFEWVDPRQPTRTYSLRAEGRVLQGSAGGPLEAPADRWGVAEHGMAGTLLPSLERLPADATTEPFAVYRPTPERWDHYSATSRVYDEFRLFVLERDGRGPTILIVHEDGTLLYEEVDGGSSMSIRTPVAGNPRADQLQAAIRALQETGG